tara:strand:+ start:6128 stop:6766 length:639 start_codon:yes stop_codon:yes gene_type:complete
MTFISVKEKLDKVVLLTKEQREKFDYLKSIIESFIRNGHAAHMTIPGYDKTKPEIEAFMTLKGINIPIHGYLDHKGAMIIEDKCMFPRRGRLKKDGTRSWNTAKLPDEPPLNHLIQVAIYHLSTHLPVYMCYINEKEFKVFHAKNCEKLKPENLKKLEKVIYHKALVRQNLLKISPDINVLKNYIQPDLDNYMWKNESDNSLLDDARKIWEY